MSMDEPVPTGPLRFALEGQAFRRAVALLEGESSRLATALRRALPFLARREVPITLGWARALPMIDALRDLPRPIHVAPLTVEPGPAPGALVLDTNALRLLLDGVLGGDGRTLPTLDTAGLTAPQRALIGRTVEGIVRAVGEVLATRIGVNIALAPDRPDPNGSTGNSVVCAFFLGADLGRVLLVLPKNAMLGPGSAITAALPQPETYNQHLLRALDGVDLELVVELARVPTRLDVVLGLKVGDTLPLGVPVSEPVSVRIDDKPMFLGRPTTAGGFIAVRVERQA
jgi:flagellar motor switch protein FliM